MDILANTIAEKWLNHQPFYRRFFNHQPLV